MTNAHPYSIVAGRDGRRSLTALLDDGGSPLVAPGDHPQFAEIVDALDAGEPAEDVRALADLSIQVAERFNRLSDRVSVAGGHVFFDGDAVDNSLSQAILRLLDEGSTEWSALVKFMEKLGGNILAHSRDQLYTWLRDRDFTITREGNIVGYKGVKRAQDGSIVSITAGPGIVNGERLNGNLPNNPGDLVEIARSYVNHDPANGCSTGLHVGTWEYASGFGQGVTLKVIVDPRDVISVPTDCEAQKMRVCRYTVVSATDAPESAVVYTDEDGLVDDDLCECGDELAQDCDCLGGW